MEADLDGIERVRAWNVCDLNLQGSKVDFKVIRSATCFAVNVATHCVMENHVQVVPPIRTDPVATWSDDEVVRRWLRLSSKKLDVRATDQKWRAILRDLEPICAPLHLHQELWVDRLIASAHRSGSAAGHSTATHSMRLRHRVIVGACRKPIASKEPARSYNTFLVCASRLLLT